MPVGDALLFTVLYLAVPRKDCNSKMLLLKKKSQKNEIWLIPPHFYIRKWRLTKLSHALGTHKYFTAKSEALFQWVLKSSQQFESQSLDQCLISVKEF